MIYIDQQRKVNFGYFIDKSILLITFHNLNELKASHLRFWAVDQPFSSCEFRHNPFPADFAA